MVIKLNLGKLKMDVSLEGLKSGLLKNNFEILPIDFEYINELSNLCMRASPSEEKTTSLSFRLQFLNILL